MPDLIRHLNKMMKRQRTVFLAFPRILAALAASPVAFLYYAALEGSAFPAGPASRGRAFVFILLVCPAFPAIPAADSPEPRLYKAVFREAALREFRGGRQMRFGEVFIVLIYILPELIFLRPHPHVQLAGESNAPLLQPCFHIYQHGAQHPVVCTEYSRPLCVKRTDEFHHLRMRPPELRRRADEDYIARISFLESCLHQGRFFPQFGPFLPVLLRNVQLQSLSAPGSLDLLRNPLRIPLLQTINN